MDLNVFTDLFNILVSAKMEVIVFFGTIFFGYFLRLLPFVSNKFVPLICVIVGMLAYLFLKPTAEVPKTAAHPIMWKIVIGFIIAFASWAFHHAAIKPLEAKFPALKGFLDQFSGDQPDVPSTENTTEKKDQNT